MRKHRLFALLSSLLIIILLASTAYAAAGDTSAPFPKELMYMLLILVLDLTMLRFGPGRRK